MNATRILKTIAGLAVVFGILVAQASSQPANAPKRAPSPFIVGGTSASIDDFPWQVALIEGRPKDPIRNQFCGGSLIATGWVLTAAHCLYSGGAPVADITAYADVISGTATYRRGGVRTHVINVFIDPNYRQNRQGNDAALMQLADPVRPARFAVLNTNPTVTGDATVTGWGAQSEGGLSSENLLKVTVPIVDNATCNAPSSYNGAVTPNMLCAGLPQGQKDSCQGDSGGPLVLANSATQVGVVSWGTGCARPMKYGIYARVSTFVPWINETIASTFGEPAGYTRCRSESDPNPCFIEDNPAQLGSIRSIAYGANGKYSYVLSSDDPVCNVETLHDPLPGVKKRCLKGRKLYVSCAKEGETCRFTGAQIVAYGAGQRFAFKSATGSIACNNDTFGDPAKGAAKKCYVVDSGDGPAGFTKCASENDQCELSGATRLVAYGADGVFTYRLASESFSCSDSVFGDPLLGVVKACYVRAIDSCAEEGRICWSYGPATVAYGAKNSFVYAASTGPFSCDNSRFGDPAVNDAKKCYILPGVIYPLRAESKCAEEGQTCKVTGRKAVSFGRFGVYATKVVDGDVDCGVSQFGDPLIDVKKDCFIVNRTLPEPGH